MCVLNILRAISRRHWRNFASACSSSMQICKNRALARFLGAPSSARGLADILTGQSVLTDVIQESCVSYLDVVTAGVARYGPQDLIASDTLERVMEQARANFDHVIIMTTPISVASDARYVFAHAGSALAVARKDFTRRRNLKAMAIALKQARAQLLGAAFTA